MRQYEPRRDRPKQCRPCEGNPSRLVMYLATVDSATSIPSISSSPCIRGAPQSVFSLLIRRMRSRISQVDLGAATTSPGFPTPIGPKAAPMAPDHGLGLDHSDRIQNRGEHSAQPDKDQPIEVPEPHPRPSLEAKYDHLLTQDNVFSLESRA